MKIVFTPEDQPVIPANEEAVKDREIFIHELQKLGIELETHYHQQEDEYGGFLFSFYEGKKLHLYAIMNSGMRLLIISNGDGTSRDKYKVSPVEAAALVKEILK